MGDVVYLDDHDPRLLWFVGPLMCARCESEWVGVVPFAHEDDKPDWPVQCKCGSWAGVPKE